MAIITPNANRPTQPVPCDRHVTGAGAVVKGKLYTRATTSTLIVFDIDDSRGPHKFLKGLKC